jgi:hypothetical protein
MPKLSSSLPKYRCHKAFGQAIVTLAGKHHYLGQYGTHPTLLTIDEKLAEASQLVRFTYPNFRARRPTAIR